MCCRCTIQTGNPSTSCSESLTSVFVLQALILRTEYISDVVQVKRSHWFYRWINYMNDDRHSPMAPAGCSSYSAPYGNPYGPVAQPQPPPPPPPQYYRQQAAAPGVMMQPTAQQPVSFTPPLTLPPAPQQQSEVGIPCVLC